MNRHALSTSFMLYVIHAPDIEVRGTGQSQSLRDLDAFIANELQPWLPTFPADFASRLTPFVIPHIINH